MNQDAPESAGSPTPEPTATKKRRSPVERVVVWGMIAVLAGVAFVEWRARSSYSATLNTVQDALAKSETDGTDVSLESVRKMIAGSPSESSKDEFGSRKITYRWAGLLREYGTIELRTTTDSEPLVLSLVTGGAPPEVQETVASVEDPAETPMPGAAMGGGPMGAGPGGGGPSGRPGRGARGNDDSTAQSEPTAEQPSEPTEEPEPTAEEPEQTTDEPEQTAEEPAAPQ